MASETIRAVLAHVWIGLEPLGLPRALMGGVALAAWNYPRATRDVDLLIAVDQGEFPRVLDQLHSLGCRPKHLPPLIRVGDHQFAQFLYTPPGEFYEVQFDLFLAETELQKSAIQRRVSRTLPELQVSLDVLDCNDLILFKLVSGRIIDRADAAMLVRVNQQDLDIPYLRTWVSRLGLSTAFDEVWREAIPDDPRPLG